MPESSKKNQIVWKTSQVHAIEASLNEQIAGIEKKLGVEGTKSFLRQEISSQVHGLQSQGVIKKFFLILHALENCRKGKRTSQKEVEDLYKMGMDILGYGGIKIQTSKMANLYTRLMLIRSSIECKAGNPLAAKFEQLAAYTLGSKSGSFTESHSVWRLGKEAFSLGQMVSALSYYGRVDLSALDTLGKEELRIDLLKALRLANLLEEADGLHNVSVHNDKPSEGFLFEVEWEASLRGIAKKRGGNLSPLAARLKRESPFYRSEYLLESLLFSYGTRDAAWRSWLPKLDTLIKAKKIDLKKQPVLYKFVRTVERIYDESFEVQVRFGFIRDVLDQIRNLDSPQSRLLVWLAIGRWLQSKKFLALAEICLGEYHSLSTKLTQGRCTDVFGIASDLEPKFPAIDLVKKGSGLP